MIICNYISIPYLSKFGHDDCEEDPIFFVYFKGDHLINSIYQIPAGHVSALCDFHYNEFSRSFVDFHDGVVELTKEQYLKYRIMNNFKCHFSENYLDYSCLDYSCNRNLSYIYFNGKNESPLMCLCKFHLKSFKINNINMKEITKEQYMKYKVIE